ncbi:inorganic phosphate transporter [Dyella acidiphila]|uniref:Phosphate transporter n=1 Tax=Dyella acidiphila TaxID=2775866 RepID=A0ABR9G4U2_9GAMM|nr:inorganic phosphate transporter [Dyella acidiphila]MBE1159039.1 inorganic phosphate transporter [Dyella acidiphila]
MQTEVAVASAASPSQGSGRIFAIVFGVILLIGVGYAAVHLMNDLSIVRVHSATPFILLGIALLIALAFEFVNGFHDTANAVATVIYTHSLPANLAVIWSGTFNFLGVLTSTGAVAFTVVSLLPVELILQVGSGAGFAMVFALLLAAILWNLGTWYFGLPNSSSHTLIGSIIGVGLANQLTAVKNGTSGVDWNAAMGVFKGLVFSPIAGFLLAALLMVLCKALVKIPALYRAPEGNKPPPWPIRLLLILTCTGVSFSHGSNDGQKGMGLIMLILIGTVPTAYALNGAVSGGEVKTFHQVSVEVQQVLTTLNHGATVSGSPHDAVTAAVQQRKLQGDTVPALSALIADIDQQVGNRPSLREVPQEQMGNVRNDIYLADAAIPLVLATPGIDAQQRSALTTWRGLGVQATQFIPLWVKVAVALALGLGTMVGWKRIVVTVGEKIGKEHLTYAQGAAAELVAMSLIQAADMYHLPVSTTHVLTSGVAGTMAANGSGLQWSTVRNLLMAWVLTLPASIILAGLLFIVLKHVF